MTDPAFRLENARTLVDEGRPAAALKMLSGAFPASFAAEAAFLKAEAWRSQGFFERACRLYSDVLRRRGLDRALLGEAALGLASVHRSLGEVAAARKRWSQARAWLGARDSRLALEDALIDRADNRWKVCLKKLESLLAGAMKARDWGYAGFLLWASGGARRFSGDLAGSQFDFQLSLKLAGRGGDNAGRAYALFGLGGVTRIRGRLAEAATHYGAARKLLAGTDDVFGKAYAECGYANALRQQGLLAQAKAHYTRAHKLYASLGDAVDLAYVDWGLGKIALHRGELSEARKRLSLALKAFEAGGEHRGAALSKLALAQALHAAGETSKAEALFDAAVKQSRGAGMHAHLESFT